MWASLGEHMQTRMLKCPCGQGDWPHHQDAVHFMEECALAKPVRENVLAEMGAVINKEGHAQDKQLWAGLTEHAQLGHSLNSAKLSTPELDRKAKSAGALAWAMGAQQAEDEMGAKNERGGCPGRRQSKGK